MGAAQQFSLRWNNYVHHITNAFDSLRSCEDLVDVTLVCDRKKIYAHKMLLSACSEYFRDVFKENPCKHPVIIFRNVKYEDLLAIIDFMYHGEVNVEQEQLTSFLTTAEMLAVQGLSVGSTPAKEEVKKKQAIFLDSKSINSAHELAQTRSFTPKSTNRSVPSQNTLNSPTTRSPVPSSPPRKRRMSPPPKSTFVEKSQPKRRVDVHKEESNEPVDAASFSEEDGMMDVSELELSREADEAPIKEETEIEPDEIGDKLLLEGNEQAGTSAANLEAAAASGYAAGWSDPRQCYICCKTFAQTTSLKRHIEALHVENVTAVCPVCGKVCKNKFTMWVHRSKMHRSSTRLLPGSSH